MLNSRKLTRLRLMRKIQELKSEGHITPLPLQKYHVAEIDRTLMTFTKGAHIGKLLVSYDDQSEEGLPVSATPYVLLCSTTDGFAGSA